MALNHCIVIKIIYAAVIHAEYYKYININL